MDTSKQLTEWTYKSAQKSLMLSSSLSPLFSSCLNRRAKVFVNKDFNLQIQQLDIMWYNNAKHHHHH